ncbi:MAG: NADH-quinone oxidoreductase subunit J [Candidatus Latescibacteria bacterium]|nr:NADH-quinone oxidoreductase subunit J [Candidatus Latescibacterota bacterium]
MATALFYVFAVIAVASAVLVIRFRNPVYSALSLVTTFFCLAGLFVLLEAYFLSVVMVIVYAGAIMVLFLFVIMLLNLGHREMMDAAVGRFRWLFVLVLGGGLLAQVVFVARQAWFSGPGLSTNTALQTQNTETIGKLLFTEYLFPFEIASVILTVALVGVVVLVKHEKGQK